MSKASDDRNYRDVDIPGYLRPHSLSPEERQAAEKAAAAREQENMEAYKKSVALRREMEQNHEVAFQSVIDDASHILTPEQKRNKGLLLVKQPDGSLVHNRS